MPSSAGSSATTRATAIHCAEPHATRRRHGRARTISRTTSSRNPDHFPYQRRRRGGEGNEEGASLQPRPGFSGPHSISIPPIGTEVARPRRDAGIGCLRLASFQSFGVPEVSGKLRWKTRPGPECHRSVAILNLPRRHPAGIDSIHGCIGDPHPGHRPIRNTGDAIFDPSGTQDRSFGNTAPILRERIDGTSGTGHARDSRYCDESHAPLAL